MEGLLLAIDTSTQMASVALYDGVAVRAELTWASPRHHTVELAPRIAEILSAKKVGVGALTGLAVALGPGSFTGLRIGLAVGKGLALARNLPLVGVPTLDVVAYAQARRRATLYAILTAGRGRICVAPYRWRRGRWRQIAAPQITTWTELVEWADAKAVFCGEIDRQGAQVLSDLEDQTRVLSPAQCLRRAGYLAELGWQRLEQGERDEERLASPKLNRRRKQQIRAARERADTAMEARD